MSVRLIRGAGALVALVLCAISLASNASVIATLPGTANVLGDQYTVRLEDGSAESLFADGKFPWFGQDEQVWRTADSEIDRLLDESGFSSDDFLPYFFVLIPIMPDTETTFIGFETKGPPGNWEVYEGYYYNWDMEWLYPTFTLVPIPTAAWLFGSALGLLGWLKRSTT